MTCAQAVAIRGAPFTARRHATVPRNVPLRMAYDEHNRDDHHLHPGLVRSVSHGPENGHFTEHHCISGHEYA